MMGKLSGVIQCLISRLLRFREPIRATLALVISVPMAAGTLEIPAMARRDTSVIGQSPAREMTPVAICRNVLNDTIRASIGMLAGDGVGRRCRR